MPTASAHLSNLSLICCSETQQTSCGKFWGNLFLIHFMNLLDQDWNFAYSLRFQSEKAFALSCKYASCGKLHNAGSLPHVR